MGEIVLSNLVHWSHKLRLDKPPLSSGVASGCPYCISKRNRRPLVGQRIMFLTSGDSGHFGTRIEDYHTTARLDQFLVKMDCEQNAEVARIVSPSNDLYLIEPVPPVPVWMLPLSVEDALSIHENMLRGIERADAVSKTDWLKELCYPIVACCWLRRLPVSGQEIWQMLTAHDILEEHKVAFLELYDFGISLLVRTQGRPAVKRKRMQPFSHGKYLTDHQRNLWVTHFGHD